MAVLVKAADVKTCTEHRLGLASGVGGQHQHAHAGVALYSVKVFQQPLQVAVFELVALGRAVEGDGGHARIDDEDGSAGLGKYFGHRNEMPSSGSTQGSSPERHGPPIQSGMTVLVFRGSPMKKGVRRRLFILISR